MNDIVVNPYTISIEGVKMFGFLSFRIAASKQQHLNFHAIQITVSNALPYLLPLSLPLSPATPFCLSVCLSVCLSLTHTQTRPTADPQITILSNSQISTIFSLYFKKDARLKHLAT